MSLSKYTCIHFNIMCKELSDNITLDQIEWKGKIYVADPN